MIRVIYLFLFLVPLKSFAVSLPSLIDYQSSPSYTFFMSSQTQSADDFDSMQIDSGYAYSLFDSVDLYFGTRIDSSPSSYNENGFLSGVNYTFNERISLKSSLLTNVERLSDGSTNNSIAAEVTSRVKLSDHIDLHATVDYEQWQQGFEVGLGFRF